MNRLAKFLIIILLLTVCIIASSEYEKRFIKRTQEPCETDGLKLIYEYEADNDEE